MKRQKRGKQYLKRVSEVTERAQSRVGRFPDLYYTGIQALDEKSSGNCNSEKHLSDIPINAGAADNLYLAVCADDAYAFKKFYKACGLSMEGFLDYCKGDNTLHRCVEKESLEVFSHLLDLGFPVDKVNCANDTVLHVIVAGYNQSDKGCYSGVGRRRSYLEMAKLAIGKIHDADKKVAFINSFDNVGCTALMKSVDGINNYGNTELFELLLSSGADPNLGRFENSVMCMLIKANVFYFMPDNILKLVKLLFEHGYDVQKAFNKQLGSVLHVIFDSFRDSLNKLARDASEKMLLQKKQLQKTQSRRNESEEMECVMPAQCGMQNKEIIALSSDYLAVIKLIIEHQIDLGITNESGFTAFDLFKNYYLAFDQCGELKILSHDCKNSAKSFLENAMSFIEDAQKKKSGLGELSTAVSGLSIEDISPCINSSTEARL